MFENRQRRSVMFSCREPTTSRVNMIYIVTDNRFLFSAMKYICNDYGEQIKYCTPPPNPLGGFDILILHSIKYINPKVNLTEIPAIVIHLMDSPPSKLMAYNYHIIDLRLDVKQFRLMIGKIINCRSHKGHCNLKLAHREEFVLKKNLDGASRKQVSGELNISEKTRISIKVQ